MDIFVGRQPILDRNLRTFGYELLFRSTTDNRFDGTDAVTATSTVIANSFLSIGAARILGAHRGFINFPPDLLVDDTAGVLPKDQVVIEILETVAPEQDVVRACRRLRDSGFLLALDDFASSSKLAPLVELADFIKVDFRATPLEECRALASAFGRRRIQMVAEKVETMQEAAQARAMGYEYFQGYFFARPEVVAAREVPKNKLNCLRILRELREPALDFSRLEALIRVDVALAASLLRYVNSAAIGFRRRIETIRHALVALGETSLRRVVSLAAVRGLASDKPHELTRTALGRGRLCESVAVEGGHRARAPECFLVGIFSLLDAMIGRPIDELARELGLGDDARAALRRDALSGNPLALAYEICLACEAADLTAIRTLGPGLGLSPELIAEAYLEAMSWSESVLSS